MADIFPGAKVIQAFGFTPRGTPSPAQAWSVIHTAASLASAEALATRHSTNPPPGMVSATFWVNRDGSVVQSLDPKRQAPWTNGLWQNPDLSNPRIKAARLAGVNPNLRSLVTIENVSLEPGAPITAAQEAANAKIVAWAHALIGMPVSRETVIGHYQVTAIDRPNCPARDKAVIDRIVALARGGTVGTMPPGSKNAGPSIGTFAWAGFGHQLISPSDTSLRFSQALNPGPFSVIASLNLKDPVSGVPVDIDGRKPPQGGRDQVYLVEAPPFAAAAYVLRADGIFTAAPKDCSAEVADLQTQLDEANALLVQTQTELDDAEARLAAPNGTITNGQVVLT